jgi:hypothetical protein
MFFLSPTWNNKTLILPMSFCQIYIVSHSSSFDLVSATEYYQYFLELAQWYRSRFKNHIRVGAIDFIWSLWLCRNDKVFDDKNSSILQVIYRCTNTLHLSSSLQRVEHRDLFTEVCAWLEATARNTFIQHGWPHSRFESNLYFSVLLLCQLRISLILGVDS